MTRQRVAVDVTYECCQFVWAGDFARVGGRRLLRWCPRTGRHLGSGSGTRWGGCGGHFERQRGGHCQRVRVR